MRRIALLALLISVPLLASSYPVYVAETILIACIGAMGLNLLTGYTGLISTGHGAFIGVGAFVTAWLATRWGLPFWVAVPAAASTTGLIGVVVGLPSVRIRGLYLAVATLAAQVLLNWILTRPALAGTGAIAAPRPELLGDDRAYYLVLLGAVLVSAAFAHHLRTTRFGRAMIAVRDREVVASVIGIDVTRVKLTAFALSAVYAGAAGALLAHLQRSVNFEQFQLDLSIQYLAMIVIGGLGSVRGSILGAVFVTLLPIALRSLSVVLPQSGSSVLSSLQLILFGIIIIGFMLLQPRGLAAVQVVRKIGERFYL